MSFVYKIMEISDDRLLELKNIAKLLAVEGVRNNTELEDLHAGITPSSKNGDNSDVKVVSPYGEIEWRQVSRISDKEMRSLMLSVERALEEALILYEALDDDTKKAVLEANNKHRTYDLKNY